MTVQHATDANFADAINTGKPTLIDFWATWCGPCRQIAPVIDAIAAENPEYNVVKVDIDEAPAIAQSYGVMSVPTLVILNADGTTLTQTAGAKPKQVILAQLAKAN
jgi:thioredoxin 1